MKSMTEPSAAVGSDVESVATREAGMGVPTDGRKVWSRNRRLWIVGLSAAIVVGAVIAVALLRGDDTPGAATADQHDAALRSAIETLVASDGVEGREEGYVGGRLVTAVWFDSRRSGEAVVVQREELSPGEVETKVQVRVSDALYLAAFTGQPAGGWTVVEPDDGRTLAFGLALLLDYDQFGFTSDGGQVTVEELAVGNRWTITAPFSDGQLVVVWEAGSEGELRSYSFELIGVSPLNVPFPGLTSGTLDFTALDRPEPIEPPDLNRVPNPEVFGLPADFPFGG